MLPFLSTAIAGLQTGLNLFAKSEAEKKQEEAKKKALELLNRNRLSEEQINTRVNQVGNAFNTQTVEALNNQAYGINNLLNSDTARTLASAKLASQRAMAEVQTREQLYNQNAQVNNQIAQIQGTPIQGITTGEIIGGAINTGLQAYSMFKGIENQDKYIDAMKEGFNQKDNIVSNIDTTPSNNLTILPEAVVEGNRPITNVPRYDNIQKQSLETNFVNTQIPLTEGVPRDFQNIPNEVGNYFNVKTNIPIAKGDNSVYMGVGESNPMFNDYKPTIELIEPTAELEDIKINDDPLKFTKKFRMLKEQLNIPIIGEVETIKPKQTTSFNLFDYQNSYNILKQKYGGR